MVLSSPRRTSFARVLLAGAAFAALTAASPAANAEGLLDKLLGKSDKTAPAAPEAATAAATTATGTSAKAEAKPEAAKSETKSEPAAPQEAAKDSYKAGNIEISRISAAEKGGAIEIYLKITNNGKADDGLSGAEVVDGAGDITMISKVTTKEITNKDAIAKAQEQALHQSVPVTVDKDGKEVKAEPAKVEIPKPEYKESTKETEGAVMVAVPADKSATLESGETRLKLTGYKKSLKQGDTFKVMLHFRSAPNATVVVKMTNSTSLLGKVFGN